MLRVLALVLILAAACDTHQVLLVAQAPATVALEPPGYEEGVVTDVIDGDTIEVEIGLRVEGAGAGETQTGRNYDVRLLGIDTPESVDPRSPVECFGREAAAATAALLQDQSVRLVKDVEDRDGFRRLLRYVYIGAEMANARLVVNGYAHAYTYPPNVRHTELFVQLEREARENNRGLWSSETCDGDSLSQSAMMTRRGLPVK